MRPVVHRLRDDYHGRVEVQSISSHGLRAQEITNGYAASFTPTFVFARPDGTIQNVFIGDVDEDRLRAEIDSLLN